MNLHEMFGDDSPMIPVDKIAFIMKKEYAKWFTSEKIGRKILDIAEVTTEGGANKGSNHNDTHFRHEYTVHFGELPQSSIDKIKQTISTIDPKVGMTAEFS